MSLLALPEQVRKYFPILNKDEPLVYLDNAATALKPISVIQALQEYYQDYSANVHRGNYLLSIHASEAYEKARETVRLFLDADDEYEIIFTSGTTDAINIIASAYQFDASLSQQKKAFLVSDFEHHSSYVPFQQCALRLQKEFRVLRVSRDNSLDMNNAEENIKDAAVLSITGMSNVTGYEPPIKELLPLCNKHGTKVLLDAAQLAAHRKISLRKLPVDAVCFSAHKLCGPTGIGVLCIRKEWLRMLPFVKTGGGSIVKVTEHNTQFLDGPEGYEAGTPHIAGAIGCAAAIDFLTHIGMENIIEHDRVLRKAMLDALAPLDSFTILGNNDQITSATIAVVADSIHSQDMSFILDAKKICVRTGHVCAQPLLHVFHTEYILRISAYFYNTLEDIQILTSALQTIHEINKSM